MYKLKIKQGENTIIRKRGGFQETIVGGYFYTQEKLEKLYNDGHKNLVSYTKPKKVEEDNKDGEA
jgi:hypothetical protein